MNSAVVKRGILAYILIMCLFSLFFYTFYTDFTSMGISVSSTITGPAKSIHELINFRILTKTTRTIMAPDAIYILLWTTSVSPRPKFYIENETLPDCPVKCQFTDDKLLIDEAHSVVVLGIDDRTWEAENNMPPQRKSNQIRVFYLWESPHWFPYEFTNFPNSNAINWTMTYRRDSTIPEFYGNFRPLPNTSVNQNEISELSSHSRRIPLEKMEEYKSRFLQNKSKLIAWTVTRCHSVSRRESLVEKLKQFLPVDQYGSCGPLKCQVARYANDWTSCYRELGQKYKFYLSMENSLCVDYVTEKLFLALQNNMVPIVYGGANYEFFAPPGSYINAMAFGTVKELADYIKFLDDHPEEYLKYFLWRDKFEIYYRNRWCTLCERLWDVSMVDELGQRIIDPSYHHVHDNVANWYHFAPKSDSNQRYSTPACQSPPDFV